MGNLQENSLLNRLLRRRLVRLTISILGFALIIYLLRAIIISWQRGSVVVEEENRLQALRQRNEALKRQYEETLDPEFVARMAREKLNLSREGEVVVLLPPITPLPTPTPTIPLETWQEWLRFFRF